MPTRDDIYRKFGEVSEAAQLIETDLGTMALFFGVVHEGLITPTLDVEGKPTIEVDGERATELLRRIDRQTLGQLVRNTKRHTDVLDQLEPMLSEALKERNRLSHHFYRQHNLRINTDAGRTLMMADLESMHNTLIRVFKLLSLLSGIDLDALARRLDEGATEEHLSLQTKQKFSICPYDCATPDFHKLILGGSVS